MVSASEIGPMLTVREVAHLLHIHENTVRRWSDRGIIKAYRISHRGDRRFRREDIARYFNHLNPDEVKDPVFARRAATKQSVPRYV